QYGSGQAWRDNTKFSRTLYENNTSSDNIKIYRTSGTGAYTDGNYAANTLSKLSITDEQGSQILEFRDNQGNLVEKWVQENGSSFLKTTYIYDDYDRLRYVMQPQAYGTA